MIQFSKEFFKRLSMTLVGVLICSFSVGMFNIAAFGVDPFQCFAQGSHIPFASIFQYGTYYLLLSLIMLVVIFLWDKHYVGLATFINLFLTGYIVDYSFRFLVSVFPEISMLQRIIMLILAVLIMCFGSALYYTADLGVSVYDAISLIMAKRKFSLFKKVMPFKWIRVINDFICVTIGVLFGKMPGAGTIITAFFMGPLISFFNTTVAEPFLYGKAKKAHE